MREGAFKIVAGYIQKRININTMGRYERSIKIAFDKNTGEVLDADEVFDKKIDAFEIRRLYHEKILILSCCECNQDLTVSGSKNDRLHFKHKPGHGFCDLADGNFSPKELETYTKILKAKESARHKELKNKIGHLLKGIEGIEISTIAIDNRFIIRENEKRKPDVYCQYYNKELVFEIQLSDLSLGYILNRYNFYRKHGMYLIWVLDNFDNHNQGTLERDIKYLTEYENFFKLDEKSETFRLECEYKISYLTSENELRSKWFKKSVPLNQIKFNNESYQIYYHNYGENRVKKEFEQRKRANEIEEAEKKRMADQRLIEANSKVDSFITEIQQLRQIKSNDFRSALLKLFEFEDYDIKILNSTLGFTSELKNKRQALLKWIKSAKKDDSPFIEFILKNDEIELDVNIKDQYGKTAFQLIYENDEIPQFLMIKLLFLRGYELKESDKVFLSKLNCINAERKNDLLLYEFCNKLTDKSLVDCVFNHRQLLFIIESARQQKIIGFNYKPNEWTAFSNNAIQYHSEYWEYIEIAFIKYGLWDKLIQSDRNKTFEKKLQTFYSNIPKQKYDFDQVFRDLFPELLY